MSTVRQHLGLLWIERRTLGLSNPQFDRHWAAQAALFVETHLDELIALAGGADLEEWAGERYAPIPADFPRTASTDAASRGGAQGHITKQDALQDVEAERELFEAAYFACNLALLPPIGSDGRPIYANREADLVWQGWLAARTQADAGKADAERLDWVLANRMLRVQGSDANGWHVLDCSNGLTFVVQAAKTSREAIDAARNPASLATTKPENT